MRKLFGALFGISLGAALVLGTVYAWTASETSTSQQATVGTASFNIDYTPNGNVIGPNDGNAVTVGEGAIENTGDFPLTISAVTVTPTSTSAPVACPIGNFTGSSNITYNGPVNPGDTDGQYFAKIATAIAAPADCQGKMVNYTVSVDADT